MTPHFYYSKDFYAINDPKLAKCCVHVICTKGEGSFVFNDKCFRLNENSIAVVAIPTHIQNIAAPKGAVFEWFAADYRFLQSQLPANNYSIGGGISLNGNPVIPLSEVNAQRFLDDIHRLRDRMDDVDFKFYEQLMGSLCLTMIYDIFEFHLLHYGAVSHTDRAGYIVASFTEMLSTGICRTEREPNYYAKRLHVSSKYLSDTLRRLTGQGTSSFINRYAIAIMKDLLNNPQLSLTQISEMMNFQTLSYFSRYCTKHLGVSPSAYRKSLQPK